MPLAAELHAAFGLPAPDAPDIRPSPDLVRLRTRLLRAEFDRLAADLGVLARTSDPDLAREGYRRVLERLATLRYVVDGTAVALGLPIDEAVVEVHRAHLRAKLTPLDRLATVPKADMEQFVPDIIDIDIEEI